MWYVGWGVVCCKLPLEPVLMVVDRDKEPCISSEDSEAVNRLPPVLTDLVFGVHRYPISVTGSGSGSGSGSLPQPLPSRPPTPRHL
jgi:hypothetical protein